MLLISPRPSRLRGEKINKLFVKVYFSHPSTGSQSPYRFFPFLLSNFVGFFQSPVPASPRPRVKGGKAAYAAKRHHGFTCATNLPSYRALPWHFSKMNWQILVPGYNASGAWPRFTISRT